MLNRASYQCDPNWALCPPHPPPRLFSDSFYRGWILRSSWVPECNRPLRFWPQTELEWVTPFHTNMQTAPHLPDSWSLQLLVLSIYWVTSHLEQTEHDAMFFIDIAEMRWIILFVYVIQLQRKSCFSLHQIFTVHWRWIPSASSQIKPRQGCTDTQQNPNGMRWESTWEKQVPSICTVRYHAVRNQTSCIFQVEKYNFSPFSVSKWYHC